VLPQQLQRVQERVRQACQRAGRDPGSVTLIGVTKGIPVERIREALAAGLSDLGENRVQEARQKYAALHAEYPAARWHLIGTLQRNKAKDAVALFDVIQSVDSLPLIETLNTQCETRRRTTALQVMIQVNVTGEPAKHGCRPQELAALAAAVGQAPHLRLMGLMTIAPYAEEAEASRPVFQQLRQLRDALGTTYHLSMGMSQDFEVAIEEDADYIRIGTAMFGERAP